MEVKKMKNIVVTLAKSEGYGDKIKLLTVREFNKLKSNLNYCRIKIYNIEYIELEKIKFNSNDILEIYEKLATSYKFKACTFTSFLLENKYVTSINNRILIELNKLHRKILCK
jgi:hypothetical protein